MDAWRDEVHVHRHQRFVDTGLIARNKVRHWLKVVFPNTISIKVIPMRSQSCRIERISWICILSMSHGPSHVGYLHSLLHIDRHSIATSSVHLLVVDDVTDIVQVHPWFEVVLLGPHDLSNDELEKDGTGGATAVTLFDVINAAVAVAGVVRWSSNRCHFLLA
jgi:hypothetical protein